MQKTVYICDRCGKESEKLENWNTVHTCNVVLHSQDYKYPLLCPSCSSRALEKPYLDADSILLADGTYKITRIAAPRL